MKNLCAANKKCITANSANYFSEYIIPKKLKKQRSPFKQIYSGRKICFHRNAESISS